MGTRPIHARAVGRLAAVACFGLAVGAASPSPSAAAPATAPAATASGPPTTGARLVAVGDIASSGGAQALTAAVAATRIPQRVVALGDLAYPTGSPADFTSYYAPAYGRFASITWPVPGNHEYMTAKASGFRGYFGITGRTWWAHHIGAWTVIGLDSEQATSSAQQAFLKAALVADDGRPTIVVWHRPRFSTGLHRDATDTQALWFTAATDRDVRIVLWGHDHDYERMSVPVGSGRTVQAIVVGTGGAELRPFATVARSSTVKRIAGTYGVLDLRLRATGWSWFFVRTDGTVADSGSRAL